MIFGSDSKYTKKEKVTAGIIAEVNKIKQKEMKWNKVEENICNSNMF